MSLASAAERPWALDREIVIARVFEQRDATLGSGAVALGYQTMDKLADHLRTQQ